MRILLSALCAIFGVLLVTATPTPARNTHLLGAKECTWGPGFWCSNITNAKGCHAVRHCIQTVWEKQTVPEDNDSICQICLDMVKQARDQLESNETQEDLKAVFEGSCKLIPLKPVQKECMKLADDFIPELVEALASQMNPQVVCSVAGLCNNAAIDKMLEEYALISTTTTEEPNISPSTTGVPAVKKGLTCSGCNNVATIISNKFHSSNRDVVLENMLHLCGKLSSFSDACSNIVITYFNEIYDQLKASVNSESICHMSGVCSSQHHQHPEIIEIRPMSDVGFIPVKEDIPCELCEQLVRHLRDLLIANTTEEEFKQVLEGLCNQSKGFKSECLSIVDQYYDSIYQVLVNNLDENGACFIMGLCPKGDGVGKENIDDHPIMPLLPMLPPQKIHVTINELPKKQLLGENEPKLTKQEINSMQLPIDKLMGAPHPKVLVEGGQLCTFCEYFLHFIQEALSTPSNEEKIKHIVSTTCSKLPTSVRAECDNFIDEYGDAVIALLIQEIDPSQICPMMNLCPQNVEDMEVFAPKTIDVSINSKSVDSDKPTCPLCLFAVQQAQEMIKSDKSKDNIRRALDNLCSHLPKKLEAECVDFIDTYSKELVEMLVTDFTPQEICVYIKLCTDKKPDLSEFNIKVDSSEDILTNEIPDNTVNGIVMTNAEKEYNFSPQCSICITVMNEVEKRVINKKSKEQIKYALDTVCHVISKYEQKCEEYIKAHGDQIADLIMKEIGAKQICRILGYCIWSEADDLDIDEALTIDVIAIPANHGSLPPLSKMTGIDDIMPMEKTVLDDTPCVLCEFVMVKLEKELHDKKTQDEIKNAVQNICTKMPKTVAANCKKFIDVYADLVISVIDSVPPKEVCQKINLCPRISTEVTDEIIECGVCHGTVSGLYSYIKDESSDLEHPYLVEHGCENLPARYYKKCSELINYYGESIINLVRFGVDQSEICAKIGKCFEEEKSSWAYMSLNAANNDRRTRRSTDKLVGQDKCTWGPSYWCSHADNAAECKTTSYCEDKVWGKAKSEN